MLDEMRAVATSASDAWPRTNNGFIHSFTARTLLTERDGVRSSLDGDRGHRFRSPASDSETTETMFSSSAGSQMVGNAEAALLISVPGTAFIGHP
jgi:hypothetical protein